MALFVPFRGISYSPEKVGNLRDVVAPPYDVISPEEQDALYRRHPHNIVRLILNKETAEDTPRNNRYTRAADDYRVWLKEGVLSRAPQPVFYFLEETFKAPSFSGGTTAGPLVRRGFIGLVHLEEFSAGVVLPHEKTQNKPKADRLALMEHCRANFSQIYALYEDKEGAMNAAFSRVFSAAAPDADVTDDEGIRRRLWRTDDPGILSTVKNFMQSKKIYIADGHHRYETALAYRDRQRSENPRGGGRAAYEFTMMYLTALEDEGVVILPTHRVVANVPGLQSPSFLARLGEDFQVQSFPFSTADERLSIKKMLAGLRAGSGQALGLLLQNQYFLLTLKDLKAWERTAPNLSATLRALDVNLLQVLIFQKLLNIGPRELTEGKHVLYFKDPWEAAQAVHSGKGQMAFFLNPTRVSQVRDVSLAGETMPTKSTFFYPKLLSGLVVNPLEPDEDIAVE